MPQSHINSILENIKQAQLWCKQEPKKKVERKLEWKTMTLDEKKKAVEGAWILANAGLEQQKKKKPVEPMAKLFMPKFKDLSLCK